MSALDVIAACAVILTARTLGRDLVTWLARRYRYGGHRPRWVHWLGVLLDGGRE